MAYETTWSSSAKEEGAKIEFDRELTKARYEAELERAKLRAIHTAGGYAPPPPAGFYSPSTAAYPRTTEIVFLGTIDGFTVCVAQEGHLFDTETIVYVSRSIPETPYKYVAPMGMSLDAAAAKAVETYMNFHVLPVATATASVVP